MNGNARGSLRRTRAGRWLSTNNGALKLLASLGLLASLSHCASPDRPFGKLDADGSAGNGNDAGGTGGVISSGGTGGVIPSGGTGGVIPSGGTGGVIPSGGTGGVIPSGGTGGVIPSGGTGGVSCDAGNGECGGSDGGCQADGSTDPDNCGGCGKSCPYRVCQASTCVARQWGFSQVSAPTTTKLSANTIWALRINVASGGSTMLEALGISLVVDSVNPPVNMRLALYADSTGAPNALVAQSGSFATVNGVNEPLLATPVSIAAGMYWVAFNADGAVRVQIENNTTTWAAATSTFGTFPSTFPLPSTQTLGIGHVYAVTAP